MNATDKQKNYIKSLINGLKPENYDFLQSDTTDSQQTIENQKLWMAVVLGIDYKTAKNMNLDDIRNRWVSKLAEIELTVDNIDMATASNYINVLKNVTLYKI
jgi:hypothetical protein